MNGGNGCGADQDLRPKTRWLVSCVRCNVGRRVCSMLRMHGTSAACLQPPELWSFVPTLASPWTCLYTFRNIPLLYPSTHLMARERMLISLQWWRPFWLEKPVAPRVPSLSRIYILLFIFIFTNIFIPYIFKQPDHASWLPHTRPLIEKDILKVIIIIVYLTGENKTIWLISIDVRIFIIGQ